MLYGLWCCKAPLIHLLILSPGDCLLLYLILHSCSSWFWFFFLVKPRDCLGTEFLKWPSLSCCGLILLYYLSSLFINHVDRCNGYSFAFAVAYLCLCLVCWCIASRCPKWIHPVFDVLVTIQDSHFVIKWGLRSALRTETCRGVNINGIGCRQNLNISIMECEWQWSVNVFFTYQWWWYHTALG